jgi:hypothetical protein
MDDELKSRAIRTVYQLIELSEGQVDQNDILALGIFFGSIDPIGEEKAMLREALEDHRKSERDRGNLANRVSGACTALLRIQTYLNVHMGSGGDPQAIAANNGTVTAWNVISELKSLVDHYEDAVQFVLKEKQS